MEQLVGGESLIDRHRASLEKYNQSSYDQKQHLQNQNAEDLYHPFNPQFYMQNIHTNPYHNTNSLHQQHLQTQKNDNYQEYQENDDQHHSSEDIVNQIKPYVDEIMADQSSHNKQIQKELDQLKNLQKKIKPSFEIHQKEQKKQNNRETNYLLEIQRTVDQLIGNAEQESSEFKLNQEHYKNTQNFAQNYQGDQEDEQIIQKNTQKNFKTNRSQNMNQFFQGISDLQERLFNEIMFLRQDKQQVLNYMEVQRERYGQLQKRYRILQKQYNRLLQRQEQGGFAQEDFSEIMNKSFKPSQSHTPIQNVRSKHQRNLKINQNNNENNIIRSQIGELQQRLRSAQLQKIRLMNQIKSVKKSHQPNNRFQSEIQRLGSNLASSQRKAAALFPYKLNNQKLLNQLYQLRSQNHELRGQSHKLENQHKNKAFHSSEHRDGFNPRVRKDQFQTGYQRNILENNQDKLGHYRQILDGLRNINL